MGGVYPTSPGVGTGALIEPMIGTQTTAVDAVLTLGANNTDTIQHASKATAFIPVAAAVGESMAIVLVIAGGAVVGSVTVDDTTPAGAVDIPLISPAVDIPPGAVLLASLDYTAGGGPTPLAAMVIRVDLV